MNSPSQELRKRFNNWDIISPDAATFVDLEFKISARICFLDKKYYSEVTFRDNELLLGDYPNLKQAINSTSRVMIAIVKNKGEW